MRAVDLAWEGQCEPLSIWLDKKCPAPYDISEAMMSGYFRTGQFREGFAWKEDSLKSLDRPSAFFSCWKISMETNILADEAAERATTAIQKLKAVSDSFRANTKNDVASMKAASERVQNEVAQMSERYKTAMALLNSPDFAKAVEQAERMAKALESIAALSETKLSVAVFAGGKTT